MAAGRILVHGDMIPLAELLIQSDSIFGDGFKCGLRSIDENDAFAGDLKTDRSMNIRVYPEKQPVFFGNQFGNGGIKCIQQNRTGG